MNVTHLACALCGLRHSAGNLHNLCRECGKPLLVYYDLGRAAETLTRESLQTRESSLWRYREVMPVNDANNIVSLGEGWTPLFKVDRLAATLPVKLDLYIKDEGQNPTQSFKARGMTAAISMAKELGVTKVAVPSAGNAAGAMAAYAAKAGMEAHIFMPSDTPRANIVECERTGAHVTLVDGLITDCGRVVAERKEAEGWFDVSTLKEPYRVEGKKTMGYEIAEQFGEVLSRESEVLSRKTSDLRLKTSDSRLCLPDVIIYPTGGGTGLIGMWKAFDEMEQMGWIDAKRPRMVSVQSSTCAPIVRAFEKGERFADEFENAATVASGLRVPKAIGDFLILDAIRASGGTAIAVDDEELIAAVAEIGAATGIFAAPEGAACLPALRKLIDRGDILEGESVVLFNTGSGIKYLERFNSDLMTELRIGVSGWTYPEWRGVFYPKGLVQRRELEYVGEQMNSAEINGSFYSLQSPASYKKWAAATPDDFVFAVKGGKFITHTKKLTDVRIPLANFFASGILLLGDKLGPILWQFAPWFRFDADLISEFLELLPRSTGEAAELARENTIKLISKAWTQSISDIELRYAFEPRHESFLTAEFVELLRGQNAALAIANTGGKWPYAEDITADFLYIRLHGEELYTSDYTDATIDRWARRIKTWQRGSEPRDAVKITKTKPPKRSRDIYAYFDNSIAAHAPFDAVGLAERLGRRPRA